MYAVDGSATSLSDSSFSVPTLPDRSSGSPVESAYSILPFYVQQSIASSRRHTITVGTKSWPPELKKTLSAFHVQTSALSAPSFHGYLSV